MTALSNYMESGLLHHLFRGETLPKPASVAIALCSGVPIDADTGATIPELPSGINGSGTGYARYDIGDPATLGDAFWNYTQADHDAGSGQIKNASTFLFGTALIDWGWVSGMVLLDTSNHQSGNVIMYTELSNPRIMYQGDSPKFDSSTLQLKFK